jgi:dTDP-4-amino-4,6-dideoxygalactose transaminase
MVSDSLGPGLLERRLVKDVAEYLGCAGGVALREYGRAIGLALDALGLERGCKVIVSALAPRVYLDVLRGRGIEAIFCDVDEDSGCLSPAGVLPLLEQGIAAIVVHATLGFAPDMNGFAECGVPIIEDISQAVGAHTGSRKLGACGNYTVISMEPDGVITAGGGVLLLCRGRKEAGTLSKLTETLLPEALLPDFNAALGITQIKNIEKFIERRRDIAAVFSHAAMQGRHKIPTQKGDGENVFFSFPVLLVSGMKDVQAYARKKGVETQAAFAESVLAYLPESAAGGSASGEGSAAGAGEGSAAGGGRGFPVARSFLLRCLLFPLYPSLTKKSVDDIAKILSTLP